VRLAAVILAMFLIFPGVSWGQGPGIGTRAQSGPQQTNKSSLLEQQKKKQMQLKNRKIQQSQSPIKSKKRLGRTQPPEQPIRSGPLGARGK